MGGNPINIEKFKPKNDTQRLVLKLFDKFKELEDQVVTKDAMGVAIPTSYSASPSMGHYSNAAASQGGNISAGMSRSAVSWPAPQQWPTHGKEAAKKAWVEYLNAANQFQQEEGVERKLELAGRMNIDINSIIQGIQIGTEAAEEVQKRVRSGDQAAVLDKEQVKDTISKLLKLLWVHNTAARSGKHAGLEFKPMDGQLTGRLNRATQLACADDGMSLEAGEDPDAIFASEYNPMPSQEQQMQAQQEAEATAGAQAGDIQPEMEGEQMEAQENPAEEQAPIDDVAEEQIPSEETPQAEEQTPQEDLQQQAIEEEQPVEETLSPDEQQAQEQGTMEDLAGEESLPEEETMGETPVEEEAPVEEEPVGGEEQGTPEEEEEIGEAEEEIGEAEDQSQEADQERAEAEDAKEGAAIEEAEAEQAEDRAEEESEEAGEETGEALEGEEPEDDEEEEEPLYCIECDREVDQDDIDNCENPRCPFKKSEEEESVEEPAPEETEKHFIFMNREDHASCRTAKFTVKEFDGVQGLYCHDHQCPVHYEFDQNMWTSKDAHKWITKNTKEYNLKKKSAEEIVYDKLLENPEALIKGWIDAQREEKTKQTPTEEIEVKSTSEIDFEFNESQFDGALSEAFDRAFGNFDKKLKAYGV